MGNELVPIETNPPTVPAIPELPTVQVTDLYAALLADARSPATRLARVQDLTDLGHFLGRVDGAAAVAGVIAGGPGQANAIAAAYQRWMLDGKLQATTINRRISTLRKVIRLGNKYRLINWSLEVDSLPVTAYRDTAGPGHAGWLRFLETAERFAKKNLQGLRDLVVIRLLHDHGLRRFEVAGLEMVDVELDAGRLWFLGKGRSQKEVLRINKPTLLALSRYLDQRGVDPGPLFYRLDRARSKDQLERLDEGGIYKVVVTLGRKAAVKRRVWPHALRHEAITRVLELNNGNLTAAQKFGRHKDPRTTQRYDDNRKDVAGDMARLLGEDS